MLPSHLKAGGAYDSAPPPVPPPDKYVLQSDVKLLAKKLPDCSVYEGPASKNKPLCDAAADSVDCFNISHVVDVLQSKKKKRKKSAPVASCGFTLTF